MNVFAFGRRNRSRELLRRTPAPMTKETLLEALGLIPESGMQAIYCLLAGLEEMAKEQTSVARMGAEERTYYAGGIGALAEAQVRIQEWREAAERMKGGDKRT